MEHAGEFVKAGFRYLAAAAEAAQAGSLASEASARAQAAPLDEPRREPFGASEEVYDYGAGTGLDRADRP